jgi:hypothetical protein
MRLLEETRPAILERRLLEWQDERCAICGAESQLYLDHDHDTGLVRGWLCHVCNTREEYGGRWERYRNRAPAQILGLEIRYFDSKLGKRAQDLEQFRASISGLWFRQG